MPVARVLLLCLAAMTTRSVAFVDPLDAPARVSDLARSTWLLDITRAGKRLVTVGVRGHILYSDDGGSTWNQAQVPVSVTLTALSFPTPEQGWAVGHSGVVLRSSDGGVTWERQTDGRQTPEEVYSYYEQLAEGGDESAAQLREELPINWGNGPEQPWLDVWFEDDQHGFVVGPFNLIMETLDGGRSWTPWMHRVDNPGALHFNAIQRIGSALYLASEQGQVFRMDSGEEKFSSLQTPYTGSFFGLCGQGDLVLAYGLRGTVYASVDQGDHWNLVATEIPTALTDCVAFDDGYLIGSMSGQTVEIRSDGSRLTSTSSRSAPWPLTGLEAVADHPVGIGMRGVWIAED